LIISDLAKDIIGTKPQHPSCRFKFTTRSPGSPGSPGGGVYDETMLGEDPFINSSPECVKGKGGPVPVLPKNIFGKGSCYSEAIPIEDEEEEEEVTETKKRKRFGDQEEEEVTKTTKRRKKTVFFDERRIQPTRIQPTRNTFKCDECSIVVTTIWHEYIIDNFIHRLCDWCNELQRECLKKMKM